MLAIRACGPGLLTPYQAPMCHRTSRSQTPTWVGRVRARYTKISQRISAERVAALRCQISGGVLQTSGGCTFAKLIQIQQHFPPDCLKWELTVTSSTCVFLRPSGGIRFSVSFIRVRASCFHVGRVSALRGAYEEFVPSVSIAVLVVFILFIRVCENGVRKQMRTHNSPTR